MSFNIGDVVEITGPDCNDLSYWIGLRAVVTPGTTERSHTFLTPQGERPDGFDGPFYWPTADLKLIEEAVDESAEPTLNLERFAAELEARATRAFQSADALNRLGHACARAASALTELYEALKAAESRAGDE